ncbi:putative winged helix-turn-helix DNA-binding domainprotein [Vibrio phage 424E50-1]|nr:putative winged helix-turn-helix DNA-binding domainprotein [Vibrio phage 424E50-1]
MGKISIKAKILSQESIGNFKILGANSDKKDYVDVLCICGKEVSVNLYGINRGETTSCGCIKKVGNLSVGQYFKGSKWGGYTVTKIVDCRNVTVTFDTGNNKVVTAGQARLGSILNPLHITVAGVGYFGIGNYQSRIGNSKAKTPQYRAWENMISRCYYDRASRYEAYGGRGVRVCEEWHNYQTFALWFDSNWKEGFDLDKDILGDGMLYSPEVCRYIPQGLNKMLNTSRTKTGKRLLDYPEGITPWGETGEFCASYAGKYEVFTKENLASNWYHNTKTKSIRNLAKDYYAKGELPDEIYEVLRNYDSRTGLKEY